MRISFLFLLGSLSALANLFAQDYAPMLSNRSSWFISDQHIYGNATYQIDSSYQTGDTIVNLLYEVPTFCEPLMGDLRLIDTLYHLPAQGKYWSNQGHMILSNSIPGQSWLFWKSPFGDSIVAQHLSNVERSVFGTTDSVKEIVLQHYRNGQIITFGDWHLDSLLLSKGHGVLRSINPYNHPISYLQNPDQGTRPLTDAEIWDLEVGAELHIKEGGYSDMPLAQEYTRWLILDKQFVSSPDSIFLQVDRMYARYPTQVATEIDTFGRDTFWLRLPLQHELYLENQLYLSSLQEVGFIPEFYYPGPHYEVRYGPSSYWYNSGRQSLHFAPFYKELWNNNTDSCWIQEWYPKTYEAIEGLGGGYYSTQGISWFIERQPIYYKDSDEEWGQPFDFGSLVTSIEEELSVAQLLPFPNPTQDALSFWIPTTVQEVQIDLYDIRGHFVERFSRQQQVGSQTEWKASIDVGQFATGLYIYEVRFGDQIARGKVYKQ
ncbi:MAG: T9SS type A sorting domain-containing protein [Bacteroidota bacterium]